MESDLHDKLSEAKFFLKKMEASVSDADSFRYYLSAFLNAAQTVVYFMYANSEKFETSKKWITDHLLAVKQHQYLKEHRRLTTHKRPSRTKGYVDIYESDEPGTPLTVFYLAGTAPTLNRPEPFVPERAPGTLWFFEDYPDEDVISLSHKWIKGLEKMLADFLVEFR